MRREAVIQKELVFFLRMRGWFVKSTHGNLYQSGFPDLFCCHATYGPRWVEVKLPGMRGSHFTTAQLEIFPQMCACGAGVWVITGVAEYKKLFLDCNWYHYL